MEMCNHEDQQASAKVFLSGFLLLSIACEYTILSSDQSMKLLDHLLGALITLCTTVLSKSSDCTLLQPTVVGTVLRSITALCASSSGNLESDDHVASICKSVLELLKIVINAYGSGENVYSDLDLSCLGWYACQNILAARSSGGPLNIESRAFAEKQLPDALEELAVLCCDIIAEHGVALFLLFFAMCDNHRIVSVQHNSVLMLEIISDLLFDVATRCCLDH